jgi:hypothetical protein
VKTSALAFLLAAFSVAPVFADEVSQKLKAVTVFGEANLAAPIVNLLATSGMT